MSIDIPLRRWVMREVAFSLVEVTLALGVAGFCLIAVLGLLPVALKSNQAATEQTAANAVISAIAADVRSTPKSAAQSQQFAITIPSTGPKTLYFNTEGQKVDAPSAARLRATVTFASAPLTTATCALVNVTWPAPADPAKAAGSVRAFVAVDRN